METLFIQAATRLVFLGALFIYLYWMLSQTLTFNYYVHLVIGYQMCTALIHGYIEYFHDFVILQSYFFIAILKSICGLIEDLFCEFMNRANRRKPQTCIIEREQFFPNTDRQASSIQLSFSPTFLFPLI